jgi:hypothetical protein
MNEAQRPAGAAGGLFVPVNGCAASPCERSRIPRIGPCGYAVNMLRKTRARAQVRASLPNDGVYSESEAHVCVPHWQLNMRTMRPFAESSIVFTSSSGAPQRLHVRSSIVFLPVKFVVLKWFVVNMTRTPLFDKTQQ